MLLSGLPAGKLEETQELLQEGEGGESGTEELAGGRLEIRDKQATMHNGNWMSPSSGKTIVHHN